MSVKETFSAGQTREFYGAGDFFRLLETNAEITLEFFYQGREVAEAIGVQAGYAEYFKDRRFDRIRIYSATAQDVKWVVREGSDVRYDRGASQVSGVVGLDAATIEALTGVEAPTGFYQSSTALGAGAVETVFTAGANLNGAVIWSGEFATRGGIYARYAAKATALASYVDGQTICSPNRFDYSTADNAQGQIVRPVRIAAGLALYYQSNHAEAAASRSLRYTLL